MAVTGVFKCKLNDNIIIEVDGELYIPFLDTDQNRIDRMQKRSQELIIATFCLGSIDECGEDISHLYNI